MCKVKVQWYRYGGTGVAVKYRCGVWWPSTHYIHHPSEGGVQVYVRQPGTMGWYRLTSCRKVVRVRRKRRRRRKGEGGGEGRGVGEFYVE